MAGSPATSQPAYLRTDIMIISDEATDSEQDSLCAGDALMLHIITDYCSKSPTRECFLRDVTFAKRMLCTVRTVQERRRRLVEARKVNVEKKPRGGHLRIHYCLPVGVPVDLPVEAKLPVATGRSSGGIYELEFEF
jgi:hypothetical protein